MTTITRINAQQARVALSSLIDLLQDAVASGASIGFLPPLTIDTAQRYWEQVIADVERETRVLLVARDDERLVGSVQLELATKQNAPHRAEVQKLIVHTNARRQGIGQALLAAVEDAARDAGRTLLVLDTRAGDDAERLYPRHGYTRVGEIPQYVCNADGPGTRDSKPPRYTFAAKAGNEEPTKHVRKPSRRP